MFTINYMHETLVAKLNYDAQGKGSHSVKIKHLKECNDMFSRVYLDEGLEWA